MLLPNFQPDSEPQITVPATFIKNPGSFISTFNTQEALPSLIENFKMKSNLELQNHSSFIIHKRTKSSQEEISISSAIQKYSETPIAEPGKIKRLSEELSKLILLAQKVLSQYEIKLTVSVDVSSKHTKSILTTLKTLIPEVSYFSTQFLKELEIKEFVLSEEEPFYGTSSRSLKQYFSLKEIDSPAKAQQRFYLIILNRMISIKPSLVQEWLEFKKVQYSSNNRSQSLECLQNTFISLMNNHKKEITNESLIELMRLLGKYFSDMSENWFKARIADKRKGAKVTFYLED